jgi:uncharacterized protein YbjT (DUF2867 family)
MPKTAIIAGSTGLVGSHCLRYLFASPDYSSVTALVRRSTGIADPKLREQIVVNFDKLDDLPAADDVFCGLGTTIRQAGSRAEFRKVDFEYVVSLAERSLSKGAKQFLTVSSVGANAKSGNFYLRTKGEVEEALQQLPFQVVHIFRPGLLVGKRLQSRPGERIGAVIGEVFKFAMVGPLRKYRPIPANSVAKAMVKAAELGVTGVHVYHYDEIMRLAV